MAGKPAGETPVYLAMADEWLALPHPRPRLKPWLIERYGDQGRACATRVRAEVVRRGRDRITGEPVEDAPAEAGQAPPAPEPDPQQPVAEGGEQAISALVAASDTPPREQPSGTAEAADREPKTVSRRPPTGGLALILVGVLLVGGSLFILRRRGGGSSGAGADAGGARGDRAGGGPDLQPRTIDDF